MAFPGTALRWTAEAALGADLTQPPSSWLWTNVTALVTKPQVQITRGRPDQFTSAPAAKSSQVMLDDGRWVARNPVGQWFGLIGFNTPIRYLISPDTNVQSDTFTRSTSSSWGTADVGGAWTVVGTAADYSTTGTAARATHGTAAVRHYGVLAAALLSFDITVRARTAALATGAPMSAGAVFRYTDSSNSNWADLLFHSDQSIDVRLISRSAGTDTTVASATTTLTHVANSWYRLRVQSIGLTARTVRVKAWLDGTAEPDTWQIQANILPNASAAKMGLTSQRETGNTNASAVIEHDDYTFTDGWYRRHTGNIDGLSTTFGDHSLSQAYAPFSASGITRRLQKTKTLSSALKTGVGQYQGLVQQWTCEDGPTATSFASAIPGANAIQWSGPVTPAADSTMLGSLPLPSLAPGARLTGPVPAYPASNQWTAWWALKLPAAPAAAQAIGRIITGGTLPVWQLVLTAGSSIHLEAYTAAGVESLGDPGTAWAGAPYTKQLWIEVSVSTSGGSILWNWVIYCADGTSTTNAGSVVGTVGNVTTFGWGDGWGSNLFNGAVVGHIGVLNVATFIGLFGATGWSGEKAEQRFIRLGVQQHIPVSLGASSTYSYALMGPSTSGTLQAQIGEMEQADQAVVYDDIDGFLVLLNREKRYNPAVAMTLDVSLGQCGWPLQNDDGDQWLRNQVTSQRPSGSSYTAIDTTSNNSVSRRGFYDPGPQSVNLSTDADLRADAEWRVHLGTVDEARYPVVTLNLAGSPELIPTWLTLNIGSRIQIINTTALFTFDPIDLIIEGYQETFDSVSWTVTLYTSPAQPWQVWTVEGTGNTGRLEGTQTLATGVNTTATSWSIATPTGDALWSTSAGDYPADINLTGERVTVTNVTGSSSPQTATVTRSVNGVIKSHAANEPISLWRGSTVAL